MHTGGIQNYGTCVMIDRENRSAVAVLCNSMLSPAIYIAENYMSDLQGQDQYKISFASVATLDTICSFISLLILYFIIKTALRMKDEKSTSEKTSRLIVRVILLCLVLILLACLPYLIGYTYAMLWKWSAITMIVSITEGVVLCGLKIIYYISQLRKQHLRKNS